MALHQWKKGLYEVGLGGAGVELKSVPVVDLGNTFNPFVVFSSLTCMREALSTTAKIIVEKVISFSESAYRAVPAPLDIYSRRIYQLTSKTAEEIKEMGELERLTKIAYQPLP